MLLEKAAQTGAATDENLWRSIAAGMDMGFTEAEILTHLRSSLLK